MKKFICFLFCSFMMLFTSLGVQASSFSESIPSKSADAPISFVDTPTVQAGDERSCDKYRSTSTQY